MLHLATGSPEELFQKNTHQVQAGRHTGCLYGVPIREQRLVEYSYLLFHITSVRLKTIQICIHLPHYRYFSIVSLALYCLYIVRDIVTFYLMCYGNFLDFFVPRHSPRRG